MMSFQKVHHKWSGKCQALKNSICVAAIPKVIKTKRMQFHLLEVVEVHKMFVWKECQFRRIMPCNFRSCLSPSNFLLC
uniref:Uncharacterized protein n=1 Tax=Arundo donax TaxID=35708 RepID=A0A0A9D4F0_ARUDO